MNEGDDADFETLMTAIRDVSARDLTKLEDTLIPSLPACISVSE